VYNRREFLVQAMWLAVLPGATGTLATQPAEVSTTAEFTRIELEILASAMGEIIPAGSGMPSATGSGGLQYLRYLGWQYPDIQREISGFLKTLAQECAAQFGVIFPKLQPDQRVQLLATMEKNQAPLFSTFVSYVYEAYYTRPEVVGLIACAPPSLSTEDDETLLAPVRKRSHLYREVP
jgi:Gluconate 2-dehydrogenase subunit 3